MKLLVTGGAGFIGSNFIYVQLDRHPERELVCLDKLTYAGNLESLGPALERPNVKFIRGDIADREEMDAVIAQERPDVVVNFAAESHVDRSITDPAVFLRTNVMGTQVLLDTCRIYGVQRFHQVSTDEVYGDLPLDRPELAFTEDTPLAPSSPYSASKAAADLLCQAYHRTYGLPITISRCSNNYGPYQFPEKLIPLMILEALGGRPLPVYGQGLNVRDWLYVTDHCRAIDLILEAGQPGQVYNIGGYGERRNIDVVKAILAQLDKPESLISFVEDRKGHDLRYAIDPALIQRELGWRPETSFDEGLKKTIQWYLDNRSWLEHIVDGSWQDRVERDRIG